MHLLFFLLIWSKEGETTVTRQHPGVPQTWVWNCLSGRRTPWGTQPGEPTLGNPAWSLSLGLRKAPVRGIGTCSLISSTQAVCVCVYERVCCSSKIQQLFKTTFCFVSVLLVVSLYAFFPPSFSILVQNLFFCVILYIYIYIYLIQIYITQNLEILFT